MAKRERFVPGTEPHSPSTWGNGLSAPQNARVSTGALGVGLLHVGSARLGPGGILRFSALGEYLSQGNFPVLGATDIRTAGTFAVSFVPIKYLEVFVGYAASANTSSRTSPNLISALGDITLGLRASNRWATSFYAGVDVQGLSFSGVGNQGVDRYAFGIAPRLLLTWDIQELNASVPLIFHANLGGIFDSTAGLITAQKLTASEEFALGINKYQRFTFAAGLEVPFPVVVPFVEYKLALPVGATNGELTGPDGNKVSATAAMNQRLGLGLKLTPIKDLTVLAAVDIGLARSVGLGVPATPPWNFLFGASFAIDPFQRGEQKIIETVREKQTKTAEAPKGGRVAGTVTDATTKAPLAGAIATVVGGSSPLSATDDKGQFLTHEVPAGPVRVKVSREGYKDGEAEGRIEAGKNTALAFALEPDARKAQLTFQVTGTKAAPVDAAVAVKGPAEASGRTPGGSGKLEVPAGQYTVSVVAEGYLAQQRDVQVAGGAAMALQFELKEAPKQALVIFKNDRLELKQQVHFATGKAVILADSYPLLGQVVDVIVKNNVRRIRVEGHTDNRGAKPVNQTLSEDRAKAVADYLIAQGIDRARVESVGFGDSRPVAPNLTARGRELNRRVEIIVLER